MNPIKFNILFLLSFVYVAALLYTQNEVMAYGYAGLLLAYCAINFDLGLIAYLMLTPLVGALDVSVSLSILYTVIPCIAYSIKVLNNKEKLYKSNFGVYLILLATLSFLAMLLTGYFEYFHVLGLLVLIFIIAYVIVQRIINNRENVYLIANAIIMTGLLATIIPYLLSEGEFSRLRLGESVRQLSNTVGMALMLLLFLYFFQKRIIKSDIIKPQVKVIKRLRVLIVLILVFGLIATMSRGVILAISLGIIVLISNYFYRNLRKINLLPILGSFILIIIIGFIFTNYGLTILADLNIRTELLTDRLTSTAIEGGTGIRQEIWKAGLSGLEGWQILYGHGISSFQMLATRNGYDYYAHSVFIDTLVTSGVLGFSVLLFLLIKITYKIFCNRDYKIFALLVFLIMGYITHGTMFSSEFWILLAIIYGLSYTNKNIHKQLSRTFK